MREDELGALLEQTRQARSEQLDELVTSSAPVLDGVDVHVELVKGQARQLLPDLVISHKIDLVVMGTVCRTGLKGLIIGNTAEKVLNELTCSVLAVKPDGFESSVKPDV
jgi:nucleotide-binding universal stress UspA family protein